MFEYDRFEYIEPPRAKKSCPREMLTFYENRGYWAQIKKNGTNSMIFVPPRRKELFAYNRYGEKHKNWEFTSKTAEAFLSLSSKGWFVFNAELIHAKVTGMRDINYIHDVIVFNGNHLVGYSYKKRYKLLTELFPSKPSRRNSVSGYSVINENTWLAENFTEGFVELFDDLFSEEDEGLVLKKPNGKLGHRGNNWSIKCRRRTKNLPF